MTGELKGDEFRAALARLKGPLGAALLFSAAINILYLASPLYLLQIYGRVMNSGSVPTLVVLTLVVLVALAAMGLLEQIRARVLVRVAGQFERSLSHRVFEAAVARSGPGQPSGGGSQPLRDLDMFRGMIGGPVLAGLFDLPFAPLFVGLLFILHPLLGLLTVVGAAALVALTWLNVRSARVGQKRADEEAARGYRFASAVTRSAEWVRGMRMTRVLRDRWYADRSDLLEHQALTRDVSEAWAAGTRFARVVLQTLTLGLGAYLVIKRQIDPGAIFAAAILAGRALGPVVLAVTAWSQLDSSGDAVLRLRKLLSAAPPANDPGSPPSGAPCLTLDAVGWRTAKGKVVIAGVDLKLEPGTALGVIGPSGAGKTTLLRLISGVLTPTDGALRVFGRTPSALDATELGRRIGYLPQEVTLLPGTIGENVARFEPAADEAALERAIDAGGVRDLVAGATHGLATPLSELDELSGGERQRLALARALYREPDILILDEPDAALDDDGEAALCGAIEAARARGAVVVVATHRTTALEHCDRILVLRRGRVLDLGSRQDVVERLGRPRPDPEVARLQERAA